MWDPYGGRCSVAKTLFGVIHRKINKGVVLAYF
jgi:hypothetical protein